MPTSTDPNSSLLIDVKSRNEPGGEFNYGITTADRYVKTLQQCVGSDLCYRYAAKGNVSFNDALKKAESTLTYSQPDMQVQEIYMDFKSRVVKGEMELPKNTLMVFKNVLTSPKKDRDGDILRTQGAKLDPKMLLLWQHVHTLPIGKVVGTASHTSKSLEVYTAIVDLNELANDAATMVDNDMGRFSHGFRALEYEALAGKSGKTTGKDGFDVKSFEVMEESLVSVPANTDAGVQEIMLDLIESDKLTSSMMKGYGKRLRENNTTTVSAGGLDLTITVKKADADDESKSLAKKDCGCGGDPAKAGQDGCDCAPAKTDDDPISAPAGADDSKESKVNCPDCGAAIDDGKCDDCGYQKDIDAELETKSHIAGSWEEYKLQLERGLNKFLENAGVVEPYEEGKGMMSGYSYIIATKADYAIVMCSKDGGEYHYKIKWTMTDGEAKWAGAPEEVQLKLTVQDKVFHETLKEVAFGIKGTIDSIVDEPAEEDYTVSDALEFILTEGDADDFAKLTQVVNTIASVSAIKSETLAVNEFVKGL